MKKFMIFLLMAFLFIGTSQARSEASYFNSANAALHSWINPTASSDMLSGMDGIPVGIPYATISPSQPQSTCLACPHNSVVFGVSYSQNGSGLTKTGQVWYVNDHATDSTGTTFTFAGYAAGSYTVECKVYMSDGSTVTSNAVTVAVTPGFAVNVVGPTHACQNDIVTLTAQIDGVDLTGATYQWRRNGNFIVDATQPSYSFSVASLPGLTDTLVYEFDVLVITHDGCDQIYSPVHYFSVSPTPVVEVSAPLYCANTSVTMTANAYTSGSETPYKWYWVKGNDTTTTYVNTLTVTETSGTIYNVIPVYQDFSCNPGTNATIELMTYEDSLNITKDLTITLAADPTSLCVGGQTTLTVTDANTTSYPAIGAATYTWYVDGQVIEGVSGMTYTVNADEAGTHTYSVVATYANFPCQNPSASVTVNVDAAPTNVVITGDNVICWGDQSTLTAHADGAASFEWSSGETANTYNAVAGVYTVTAISANGCRVVSDPFTVYEFGADVHVTASATEICNGTSVVLNANADGWTGNVVYTWEDGTHYSSITVSPNTTTIYKVTSTVTSTSGIAMSCSRVDSIRVEVLADPLVSNIQVSDDTICEGNQILLKAVGNEIYDSYTWYENGIEIPGQNLHQIIVAPAAGYYKYSVKASNGICESGIIETDWITVNANPTIQITGDQLICNDSLITLYANINDTTATTPSDYYYDWRVYNFSTIDGDHVYTDPLTGEDYRVIDNHDATLSAYFKAQDHPYIFRVVATNDRGCVSVSDPYNVYVQDTIFVAVTLDYDTVCRGGEVTATAHLGNYHTDNLVFQWYKNGVLIPYATSPWFTTDIVDDPTELRVEVTQTTTGCHATGADTAYIFEPVVLHSVVAINGTNSDSIVDVCEGAQITVVAFIDDQGHTDSTLTYVWKENGFLMPLATDYKFSKQMWILDHDSANYTYEAYIDYQMPGCHAVPVSSNTVHVRRNPRVGIEGVHNVCFQGILTPNIHLTAWVDGIYDTNAVYNWYRNNALVHSTQVYDNYFNEMIHPTNNDPVSYVVEVVNGDGCSAFSEPFEVNVYAKPVVNILASEVNVCNGGEVELQARIDNYNDPMLTLQWYENELNNAHILHGRTHEHETYTLNQTTTFYAHVKHLLSENTNEHTICDAYDTLTVYVVNDPVIDSVTNDLPDSKTLCDGRSVTFHAHISGGVAGGEVFTWYRNGEIIPNAVDAVFTETVHAINDYPTNYVYSVSVKQAASGCESDVVLADTVTVNPNPTVEISTDPIVCINTNGNIVMTANVVPAPTTEYTFAWFEDNAALTDGTITGTHDENITLTRDYRDYPYNFSVSLVNAYGCQAVADAQVYVDTLPVINITATETNICVGGEITLTANLNNWNTPNMQYQWYDNGTLIAGATSLTYTVVPTQGNHKYTFTAEQLNSHCNAISNEVEVNVVADPTLTVTNDLPTSKTLCDGRSVTFAAHVDGGVAGGEVYTWYRNGEVIPNAVGATFTETVHAINDYPTTYVYAVSVKQTAAGCESDVFAADTVTVNPNPTVVITTDPIVCDNSDNNITMIANVDPAPTTDYTFNWFEENVALTSTITGAHKDTITLTRDYRDYPYNFSVSLVNAYGCQAVAEAQVYVDTLPVINIAATETNICVGGEITLTANLNNWNTPNMQYQWYDNGTLIAGATSLTYTVVPTQGNHKYTFTAEQLNSHCNAISNEVEVNVVADPTLTVTNDLPASNTLCDGRSVTFTATVAGGVAGGEVYTWYRNGEVIPNAVGATFTETVHAINDYPTTYVYKVSVKQTAAGCESNVYEAGIFTVNPNPTIEITTDPIVCSNANGNIVMTANVYPAPTTDYTFSWFEENVALTDGISGTHSENITLTRDYRDYPYNFSVSLVNAYGCQAVAEAHIYVDTLPVINITATETTICEGGEITLTANLNNWNTPNMQYQWFDNGTLIAGATSLTYTVVPTLGSHEYTFTAEQLNSHCHAISNAVTVNVIADPVIASVSMTDTIVCQGAQIAITANAGNYTPSTDDVYTWYRNGILMPNATAQTIYDSPVTVDNNTQQYIYTAVVTRTPSGCTSLPVASAALTIYPNPTVVITGDQHVCETDSIFLIANVDTIGSNVGTLHYTWYESGMIRDNMAYGLGDNQFYNEYWYPRTEPYRFVVEVQREGVAAACAARSAEYLVYVYPQPIVNITATETEICTNGEVTLTANLVDPNAENIVYQWYEVKNRVDSFATGYDANHNMIYTYQTVEYRDYIPGANSATYAAAYDHTSRMGVVVFQTPSSCSDNDEIIITVNPIPVVTAVTVNNAETAVVCDGAQVNLAATIDPADAQGAVYTWFRNGIEIPGANQSTFSENVYTTDNHTTINVYTAMVTLPASGCVSEVSTPHADVTINPAPTTVSISGENVICENDSTLLTVYSDVPGTITWSTGSHETSIYVQSGVYTATMTTAEGCEMTSEPFTVEAYGSDLFVTASATSICQGEHTTLYADQAGYVGNVTYQWDAQAGNSTANTVDVQPNVTTTYHVTATVTSSTGTCNVEREVTIIVNPLPAQVTVTPSATVICQNQQVTFHANGDSTTVAYIWYQNGVEIPGENQADLTVNFPDFGSYTFATKAISNEGCISALASEPVTVTVNPAPTVVSITGNNVICENDSTVLTAYSDVPGVITWSTGANDVTTITVPAGVYTATMTTAEGCQLTSDPFTVEALGSDLFVTASETSICQGEHTTLYANQNGWAGNVTYQWDANANNSTATTVDVQPDVTTTYHVTATVHSTNGTCSVAGEVTIIVNQLPAQVTVTANQTTICQDQQVTFHATGDASTVAYIWYQNGVEIPGENQADLTVNFPDFGTYTFASKAISDQGCVSAIASEPVTVTVNAAPSVVSITGNNVICENDSTLLTVYSDVPGTITWSTGSHATSIYVQSGVYTATMTTAEGCELTSAPFTVDAFGSDIFVTASETSICKGEHTTLYADQAGYVGNVTYAWDANANNSTANTVDVQPDVTTTYHVTATVTSSTGTCNVEREVTIIVNQLPAQLAVTANQSVICQDQQVTFHATGDATTVAYVWYQNGVEIPGENQADLTVNFPAYGNYTFAAKAISDEGCVSALASEPVTITVKPAPATVTITGNNVICENDVTTLTAHSDVLGAFVWNDGTVGSTNTVVAGVYNVTITTPEGCSLTSDNFEVVAFGSAVQLTASQTAICEGEHTTLYAAENGWQGNVTYTWSNGSHASSIDVTPAVTTTYFVTSTVNSTNGTCQRVDSITIIVTRRPARVNVTPSANAICEGEQVTFTADGDAYAYIWYQNGVEIPGENQAVLTVNFPVEGQYTFQAKAVNDQYCESAVASIPVTVTVNAAPDQVVVSGNLEICGTGHTILYANATPNVANASYQWYKNGVAVLAPEGNGRYLVVDAAGSYKVEVTTNGCTTVSNTVDVTVQEAPQLQLTATEQTICQNGSTVISAEATGWNNADVNYNWSCAQLGNNFSYQGSVFTFAPALAGDYTFSVTASQATSGCVSVDEITIHVNVAPAAPALSVDNAMICEGAQITLTLTDTNTIDYGTPTITWFDNGAVLAGTQNTLTITPALGDHAYTATVTYPFAGCNTAYSAAANVTVLPLPTVAVVTTGNTTICEGGSTTFTANVTPAGTYNYQWFVDNVEITGANAASYTVANAIARETAYNYTVVVSSLPGCLVVTDAPALTVVADPVVVATVDNNIICAGGNATFSATVDGGVANVNGLNGYTYAWYVNSNHTTPVATTPTFTVNNAVEGSYAYELVVTSPYGCQSTSNVVNFSVVADPTVVVAVAQGYPATICDGGSTMLIANVAGGYGVPSYQWYKNGIALSGETFETLTVSNVAYNSTDVYTVTVSQSGVDCIATSTNTVNPFTVVPAYTVNITGNNNTCPGGNITLTATVNGLVAGDVPTYQWFRVSNGIAVAINGATQATYTTPALLLGDSYDYYVEVTSAISGCSVTSGTVPASVVAAPSVQIVGAQAVCENGQLPLHAYVSGGVAGEPYTYTWNWTGATTGSAVTATDTYVPTLPANDGANHYFFTVTITRNDNTGCEATSDPYQLDVYAVPTVVLTSNRDYVCEGGDVTFTANVTPAGDYNYAWTINGVANPANTPSVTTTLNNAGNVSATVVVSANNAIASCATTATIAAPVQVVAVPVVTIAANHTTMCAGGTTTLSIANIVANNNIPANYSYQWALNGFEVEGAINNTFVQNLNNAGTYNYTLKLTQNSELGCVSEWSAPVTVLVAEQPQVALSNADGLDICVGGTVTLNASVTNYGNTVNGVLNSSVYGPMTFTWLSNGSTAQVDNNINAANDQLSQTLNTVGNYGYTVVVTPSGYACQPASSNNVVVGVVNDPTWTDVHVYYPDVCVGQQVDLIANIVGGVFDNAGNTNGYIQWTVQANGITANVAGGQGGTSYDIPSFAGNYVYTPTFVGNIGSGCQFTNTADVQQPVTVHALPTAEFINVDGQTLCANDPDASVELVIAFTGGAPYYFDIYDERTNTILQQYHESLTDTFTFYVAPAYTTVYRIINLHNQWCDNNELTSAAQTVVNVNAVEFVETTFRPVNCGDDVVISFAITSGNLNEAYQVYENGTQIAAGTVIDNMVIIPDGLLGEGTHYLTLVIGGCSYDITVIIPVDGISSGIFGDNLMEQRWDDVAIINLNANPRYTFVGFQWYRNNELIPGAIYKNYQEIGGLNGFYSVEITAVDNETGDMVSFITCPREFTTVSNLKVYPVPANIQQVVTIELDLTAEELNGATLDIFDATGKLINHMTDLTPVTRVAGFKAQGTYFGRIVTGTNEIKTVKFVIVK